VDAYFLSPTHNKQEFMRDDKYRLLEDAIKASLSAYWYILSQQSNTKHFLN
jgi:hypothetical protein